MEKPIAQVRSWLIAVAVAAAVLAPGAALAAGPVATPPAAPIKTVLDGHELVFAPPPVIANDRTLVPMRGLLEALGAKVAWDQSARMVTANLGSTEIKAVIGDPKATVNGRTVTLDVAPAIVADRTLVPLRFFAENLGMAVAWNGETRTITIDSKRGELASRDGGTFNRRAATAALLAKKQVGLPYSWGGTSPETGFDCSGLVTYIGEQVGVDVPRTSQELFKFGVAVAKADLAPGDLVFFTTYEPGPSHVGIYVGDGLFVHAETPEAGVKTTALAKEWWVSRYLGARRVFR
ncbi:MAG TPA: stalk domain-containing protein [Symbiobacteriaceae bacterium]|jgi:cell wall-associated NlpC family hydrolase